MGLLAQIQTALMDGQPIGPILLKLRYLASRLGSGDLEAWVKHESEGYPPGVELPSYRKVGVYYTANFNGPFGAQIRNAPIPSYLIQQFAGEQWNNYEIRQSVSSIDELLSGNNESGVLHIDAANLILLLQGNVYRGYACNSASCQISKASIVEIQNAVRTRALELTIQIEKSVPAASAVVIGSQADLPAQRETDKVTQITNQVIHGNYTNISNSGYGAKFDLNISSNNTPSVVKALEGAGITHDDAEAIAKIFAQEMPESDVDPFGKKAKAWITKNIGKAANGTWKVGLAVATQILTEAASKYYGLK
jgi:hypothetical protein